MPVAIAAGVGAGISAITGGIQMWQGKKQEKEGKEALKNLVKPDYVIPEELKQNLQESELRALEGLPTEQKMEYIKNIERNRQNTLKAQADRKGGLLGIQQSAQEATDAFTNLVALDAQARAENEQRVQMNRNALAAAKDKKFGVAEGRYQQGLQSAQDMIGAGKQNFYGGIDTIGSGLISAAGVVGQYYGNKYTTKDTTSLNYDPNRLGTTFQKGLTRN